jgi:hypothetical protein
MRAAGVKTVCGARRAARRLTAPRFNADWVVTLFVGRASV